MKHLSEPRRRSLCGRSLALAFAGVACVCTLLMFNPAAAHAQEAEPSPQKSYRIGPKDLIDIKVFEVEELNVVLRVDEDGAVRLPLLGNLQVEGLTATEVSDKLRDILESRYVQRASVAVEVLEFRSRPISVIGAVKQPGNLALAGRWTLIEAIAAAGGLQDDHGDVVYVLRRSEDGNLRQQTIDIEELMVQALPEANVPVYAGDLINVPATVEITVFCLGEVQRPGAYDFKSTERISLLAALASAGGLTDRASNSIVIRRHDRAAGSSEIDVNYKDIVNGREPDPELERNDVVVVKESFF